LAVGKIGVNQLTILYSLMTYVYKNRNISINKYSLQGKDMARESRLYLWLLIS